MGGPCSAYRIQESRIKDSGGKPEKKRPFGRPWCRWEDTIKMDLQDVGCEGYGLDRVGSGWDRWRALVSAVMNFRVP